VVHTDSYFGLAEGHTESIQSDKFWLDSPEEIKKGIKKDPIL
tara:strand:+ start:357 stop:482 length:126 start_codon:yes stop_codon:yes gene_type:complete